MIVKAKKYLGQHFLKDENIAQKIVNALLWQNYTQVLEIGPGMGVLTKYLIGQNRDVSVIEIDKESVVYLKENHPTIKTKIYEDDFLNFNLANSFKENVAIIGNFPYNISSQIVFKIIENRVRVPEMVGMFQKEMAERIASTHNNKVYGIMSVLTQAYYQVEYLFTVNENVFLPPPKVKSAVIRLKRINETLPCDEVLFHRVVKAGFGQRRKTLRNALSIFNLSAQTTQHDYFTKRAEQLTVADFITLTNIVTADK